MKNLMIMSAIAFLSTDYSFAAPKSGEITCKVSAYSHADGAQDVFGKTCPMFMDPEFGLSGECEFNAFGAVDVKATFFGKHIDSLFVKVNGVSLNTVESLVTLSVEPTQKEYLIACSSKVK